MALELIGGGETKQEADRPGAALELAEAERLVKAARQRLEGLAEALAVLRRMLVAAAGSDGDAGTPAFPGERGGGSAPPRGA